MKQTDKIKGDNHVGFCFFSGIFSVCVFVCLFWDVKEQRGLLLQQGGTDYQILQS